jgi:hypothetical protein
VPRSRFRPAPDLWRAIRSGEIDAARCGLSVAGITGTWFPAGSVLRHAAALAMVETLPWDSWGQAREFARTRTVTTPEPIDELAAAQVPAPDTPAAANAILDRFPWARPTDTVASFVGGQPPRCG